MLSLNKQTITGALVIALAVTALLSIALSPASAKTKEEAVELVRQRPEVKEWLKLFNNLPPEERRPVIEFDHMEGDDYVVHAYEVVRYIEPTEYEKQNNISGHTATLNWFTVDSETGKISPQF